MTEQEMSQIAVFTMGVLQKMQTFKDWLGRIIAELLAPFEERLQRLESAAQAAPAAGALDRQLLIELIEEQLKPIRGDMKRMASDIGRTLAEDDDFIARINRAAGEAKTEYEQELHAKIAGSLLRVLNRDRAKDQRLAAKDIPPAYVRIIRTTGINRLNPNMDEAEFDAAVVERNETVVTELTGRVRPLLKKAHQAKTEAAARFVLLNTEDTELGAPAIKAAAKGSIFEGWFLK